MTFATPLRYPGGKGSLGPWLVELLNGNGLHNATYIEPYAGGAGAALYLLITGNVRRVIINDVDPAIHAFWHSVIYNTERFLSKLMDCDVSLSAHEKHKRILIAPANHSVLELGFAAFFLNRTNRSGILRGGVVGGKSQSGKYTLSARFNRKELAERISRIALLRDKIDIHGLDAIEFIDEVNRNISGKALFYLDPPYYRKGAQLYRNFYAPEDHRKIATAVAALRHPWIVTYDDCEPIRTLYRGTNEAKFSLYYSAHTERTISQELMFYGNLTLHSPPFMKRASPGNLEERSRIRKSL